jgi:hypothetical protein
VRNCNLLPSEDQFGFIDSAEWQSIKSQGDDAIERWIDEQLNYTSVTVVLIGAETADRPWVQHEILRSWNRGNGIVGVRISNIKDQNRETDVEGPNPFDRFKLSNGTLLSSICDTHDWVLEDGRNNLGGWIEEAFQVRSRYGTDDTIAEASKIMSKPAGVTVIRNASASSGFTPRAPWCADNVKKGR